MMCAIVQFPKHYEIGPRKLNIILTQLRCFASFLHYDLFQVNIVSDPSCRCGANREDYYHFFVEETFLTSLSIQTRAWK
jgi:hypothetical protein